MAFLDSTTAVVDCVLTRKGRELLSRNDGSFKITKYSFGDDEINYQFFDANNANNPDNDILNLPILEPVSNEEVAQRYRLITLPRGSTKIAILSINPTIATVNYGDTLSFTVSTQNGEDNQGYSAQSRDTDIAIFENKRVIPDTNGVATFNVFTGTVAGGKSGQVVLDVVGINSGGRNSVTLNVSASGA